MLEIVEIFTYGACRPNPGPGGWAWLIRFDEDTEYLDSGGEPNTTNNRMALTTAIKALEEVDGPLKIILYTDSEYLQKGITGRLENWKSNGWKNARRKLVKNRDLWERLDLLCSQHNIKCIWVRAHAGHRETEILDALVNDEIRQFL